LALHTERSRFSMADVGSPFSVAGNHLYPLVFLNGIFHLCGSVNIKTSQEKRNNNIFFIKKIGCTI
jgi:hypothetical protein